MAKIIEKTSIKKLIVDHHFLRDISWEKWIAGVLKTADEAGFQTSAEFIGKKNDLLEVKRKELYQENQRFFQRHVNSKSLREYSFLEEKRSSQR